ncbi:RNA polymerase sigma factor ShbA [Pseudonocardia kujensis]|uniref:RNA polymerase sigma factor ShbA n=1 Tax=Pseudonocardia kujensis TaxID=1128675 RepID=UPI001E49D721|nr:RNA polymerase sigma factor ShbA [Pseudonocardia kujensis]MCE0766293.1 RNA polymerase sigma factor ShbA [Pseudonocardia kujensis]
MARASAGEPGAIEEVLRIVRPFALRYCRARMGTVLPGVTAEDLAQQVCIGVLGALPRYEDRGRPFLALVHRIAVHEVGDAYRAAARSPELADLVPDRADHAAGPEERALVRDDLARLRPALDRLSAAAREVLVLRVAMGLSADETAQVVGSTPGAVRAMQHRALNTLRRHAEAAGIAAGAPGAITAGISAEITAG